ncbi:uncharacterized protein LOC115877058 [Sitophilus oryzae]|uniref:Uncharacterized protein LOC115877058 n=1 Tax=Sitophilus oryzae TaxID=7048 RepID=A0A6J2XDE8_SITOR|nr:uncharacterized protein LOC115877058 [Sitophilus oryzae]
MGEENKAKTKPPTHILSDWNYFLNHQKENVQIPLYFDKQDWIVGNMYRTRISHVYDPSKFWVVPKEKELDLFQRYLHDFYSKHKDAYRVPVSNFSLQMYCVAYTEEAFYRGKLVNIPLPVKQKTLAWVFLMDFGYMAKVELNEIYFLTAKMYTVPQFAVRSSLSGMGPVDSSSTWCADAVTKFNQLVLNKVLFCQVTNKDEKNKVLYLKLGEYQWETQNLQSINDILVMEKIAKQLTVVDIRELKRIGKNKVENSPAIFPFLLPSFSDLENNFCADTAIANNALQHFPHI